MEEYKEDELHAKKQTEAAFLRAIGFTQEADEASLRRLLRSVINDPDWLYESESDAQGFCQFEWYKLCGEGCGLVVYGAARRKDAKQQVFVEDWTIFAAGGTDMAAADFFVEVDEDGKLYGFCEEMETGNELEFRLVNQYAYDMHYVDTAPGEPLCVTGIRLAALASEGTVLLPVEKTEDLAAEREEEEAVRREMLKRVRGGDEQAVHEMNEMMMRMNAAIDERLTEEDYLTVFESYLMPMEGYPCVYGLLGEITDICPNRNTVTGASVLQITVDVTGVPIPVLVNEADLVGQASVGMRLLAKVYMLGTACFTGAEIPKVRPERAAGGPGETA